MSYFHGQGERPSLRRKLGLAWEFMNRDIFESGGSKGVYFPEGKKMLPNSDEAKVMWIHGRKHLLELAQNLELDGKLMFLAVFPREEIEEGG